MEEHGNAPIILSWTASSKAAFEIYKLMMLHPTPYCSTTSWKATDLFWRIMLGRECAWYTWDSELEKKFYESVPMWKKAAWDKAFRVLIGAEKIPQLWSQTLNTPVQSSSEEEKLEH